MKDIELKYHKIYTKIFTFLLILLSLFIVFIYLININNMNNEYLIFLNNISLDDTLSNIKEININLKEDTSLDISLRISKDETYEFKNNLKDITYFIYQDESSNYISNIKEVDVSNKDNVKEYISSKINEYLESILFYENKISILDNLNYSFLNNKNNLLLKDSLNNYILIDQYGLIIDSKINESIINGTYIYQTK